MNTLGGFFLCLFGIFGCIIHLIKVIQIQRELQRRSEVIDEVKEFFDCDPGGTNRNCCCGRRWRRIIRVLIWNDATPGSRGRRISPFGYKHATSTHASASTTVAMLITDCSVPLLFRNDDDNIIRSESIIFLWHIRFCSLINYLWLWLCGRAIFSSTVVIFVKR